MGKLNRSISENRFRILVVDDQESIRKDFEKVLSSRSNPAIDQLESELFGREEAEPQSVLPIFDLDLCPQGNEAVLSVRYAMEDNNPYALAFVDMRMPPGWDGLTTISEMWKIDPDIEVVICTAYSDKSWAEIVGSVPRKDQLLLLKKPFDPIEIQQFALALTEKWKAKKLTNWTVQTLEDLVIHRADDIQYDFRQKQAGLKELGKRVLEPASTLISCAEAALVDSSQDLSTDMAIRLENIQLAGELLQERMTELLRAIEDAYPSDTLRL